MVGVKGANTNVKNPVVPKKPILMNTRVTKKRLNDMQMPVDYSFIKASTIDNLEPTQSRLARFGPIIKGDKEKYLSRSLWLNHNRITNIENINTMMDNVFEYPERLAFLDLSHNELSIIDSGLLTLKAMKVLYLHDNKLSDIAEIFKLRQLKYLHNLTLYANPFYDNKKFGNPRTVVQQLLPQIVKLDHNTLSGIETQLPMGTQVVRFLSDMGVLPLPYIPCKLKTRKQENTSKGVKGKVAVRKESVSDVKQEKISTDSCKKVEENVDVGEECVQDVKKNCSDEKDFEESGFINETSPLELCCVSSKLSCNK